MPIGKNSIKRVKDGGYSKVKTVAPDMENSTVLANPSPEVIEKMIPSANKKDGSEKTGKKQAKATAKSTPVSKKRTADSKSKKMNNVNKNIQNNDEKQSYDEKRDGFVRFGLGESLPTHLL